MNAIALIRRLREHQIWCATWLMEAARLISEADRKRPLPIGRGTLWDSLVHLYAADSIWLAAIEGNPNPPAPSEFEFDSLDELQKAWDQLQSRWASLLLNLTEADLDRPVQKISTSAGAGQLFTTTLGDVLLHLSTHAAHTNAQTVNMLRQLNVKDLPDMQLMTMARTQTAPLTSDERHDSLP